MSYEIKNLILSDSFDDLPSKIEGVAVVKDRVNGFYHKSLGGDWTWAETLNPGASWPIGVVIPVLVRQNPADLLGFGAWELIKNEDVGGRTMYYWVRTE